MFLQAKSLHFFLLLSTARVCTATGPKHLPFIDAEQWIDFLKIWIEGKEKTAYYHLVISTALGNEGEGLQK